VSCHYGNSTNDLTVHDQLSAIGQPIVEEGVAGSSIDEVGSKITVNTIARVNKDEAASTQPEPKGLRIEEIQETERETKLIKGHETQDKTMGLKPQTTAKAEELKLRVNTDSDEGLRPLADTDSDEGLRPLADTETAGVVKIQHTSDIKRVMVNNDKDTGSVLKAPLITPPTSPPISPATTQMTEDVKDLLELLQAPLETTPPGGGIVRVPSLSRNNRYYRHSLKHRRNTDYHDNQQHHGNRHSFQSEDQNKEKLQELPWEQRKQEELQLRDLEEERVDGEVQQGGEGLVPKISDDQDLETPHDGAEDIREQPHRPGTEDPGVTFDLVLVK